ncbi:hypothetical protein [Oceanisphaera sp. IT1-181]|uniref:hypothetical protein n=1 Tax=Oceanisphaera sp. IT1-181 TaxID=3081199 RepID=UPI0029CA340F|nr:hypothetical protein [Oceanisphaera sp. IT1-181]
MNNFNIHLKMLELVARALGPELCEQMAFVGGCTTGLLLTDEFTKEQVRHTNDVDLIISVMGVINYYQLQDKLVEKGFSLPGLDEEEQEEDTPFCAMKLGDLRVDFIPDNAEVLGFTNRWYKQAIETAAPRILAQGVVIRVVDPVYFVATKLEAYKGRGCNDPLSSRDIEDILTLVDGREELSNEVRGADVELRHYIAVELSALLEIQDFEYAVQSQSLGDQAREDEIFSRLELLARGN